MCRILNSPSLKAHRITCAQYSQCSDSSLPVWLNRWILYRKLNWRCQCLRNCDRCASICVFKIQKHPHHSTEKGPSICQIFQISKPTTRLLTDCTDLNTHIPTAHMESSLFCYILDAFSQLFSWFLYLATLFSITAVNLGTCGPVFRTNLHRTDSTSSSFSLFTYMIVCLSKTILHPVTATLCLIHSIKPMMILLLWNTCMFLWFHSRLLCCVLSLNSIVLVK